MIKTLLDRTHTKFSKDNIDFENDTFIIRTFGVFLGIKTTEGDLAQVIIDMFVAEGELFVKKLRGSFALYIYDKAQDAHLLYTNQVGDKRLFYYHDGKDIILSNSVKSITGELRDNSIEYSLDKQASYQLLSFGYILEDHTLVTKIKRLKPGHYIKVAKGELSINQYYSIDNSPKEEQSEDEQINTIDQLFSNAIRLEYDKDLEYNYEHLTSLSGGLDCRMNTFAAHTAGYKKMTNFTFSQTGYLDQTLAQKMATDLGNAWLFCSLDHATFMLNIEKLAHINEGSCVVMGQMHGDDAFSKVNHKKYGLMHTGQLGDVIIGSYVNVPTYEKPDFGKGISIRFSSKVNKTSYAKKTNQELFLLNNRGYNGILTGNIPQQEHTEVASPFLDVDFLDYVLSIPLEQRIHHRIYKKWILAKHPDAAKYIWESTKAKIDARMITFRKKSIPLKFFPAWVFDEVKRKLTKSEKTDNKSGMNPFAYWYKNNPEIRSHYHLLFDTQIDLITDQELKTDCTTAFNEGTISEKIAVLTLLSAIKQLGI